MGARILKKSWWVDFSFNGLRYRKRAPENTRAGALAYEALLRQKLVHGEDINAKPEPPQKKIKFEEFAWRWFREYVQTNNKFSEQLTKKYILSGSLIPFFGSTEIAKISAYQIERYKSAEIKRGVTNKTINNQLTVLRKCLRTAGDWQETSSAPPKITLLRCRSERTDYLKEEECKRLLRSARGMVYELILTALRTGMRQGELRGLQWDSIDWESGNLIVRHSQCARRNVLESTKSNRERHIPLNQEVSQMLLRRKRSAGYVFLDADGQPFRARGVIKYLSRACEAAGLRRITWHTLRHTFASQLAIKGVPLHAVQALLGHSAISTTMRYSHVAPSALRVAIELLDRQKASSEGSRQPAVNQWQAAWNHGLEAA